VYKGNYTYFSLATPRPPQNGIFDGVFFEFNPYSNECSYDLYLSNGQDQNNSCADNTNYNNEYTTLNSTYNLQLYGEWNYSAYYLGIKLNNQSSCEQQTFILTNGGICPALCPGKSLCSNHGCGCFNNYFGSGCNITGECNPFQGAQACGIPSGLGLGNQTCDFINQYKNETKWGKCVIYECLPGYRVENNDCVSNSTGNINNNNPKDKTKEIVVYASVFGGCLIFVVVLIVIFVRIKNKNANYLVLD